MVNWVELVGPNNVSHLAKQCNVTLTSGIITLLESFGDSVERELKDRNLKHRRHVKLTYELRQVFHVVSEEIDTLRRTLLDGHLNDSRFFYVYKHSETYLPIVRLKLKNLPHLIVHVTNSRQYLIDHVGITFGLSLGHSKNHKHSLIKGPVKHAMNFLTQKCKLMNWKLSVSQIITLWIHAVQAIPQEQRIQAPNFYSTNTTNLNQNHDQQAKLGKKRPAENTLQKGRWKALRLEDLPCESDQNQDEQEEEEEEERKNEKENAQITKHSDNTINEIAKRKPSLSVKRRKCSSDRTQRQFKNNQVVVLDDDEHD